MMAVNTKLLSKVFSLAIQKILFIALTSIYSHKIPYIFPTMVVTLLFQNIHLNIRYNFSKISTSLASRLKSLLKVAPSWQKIVTRSHFNYFYSPFSTQLMSRTKLYLCAQSIYLSAWSSLHAQRCYQHNAASLVACFTWLIGDFVLVYVSYNMYIRLHVLL